MPTENSEPSYQLYQPPESEEQCPKLLPLNEIQSSLFFYQVTGFQEPVKLEDFIDPELPSDVNNRIDSILGSGNSFDAKLALPYAFISEAFKECTIPQEIEMPGNAPKIVVDLDKAFLPASDPKAVMPRKMEILEVDDIGPIRPGTLDVDGKTVVITGATIDLLWRHGEAYVTVENTNQKVRLCLKAEEYHVRDPFALLARRIIKVGEKELSVELTEEARERLMRFDTAFATVDGKPAHIHITPQWGTGLDEEEGPIHLAMSSVAFPSTDMAFYDWQTLWLPSTVICHWIYALLEDFRAEIYFDGEKLRWDVSDSRIPHPDRNYVKALHNYTKDLRFSW
jgi:hypothetical protein